MKIDKLNLRDFGQFHEKNVYLHSGINLVYGRNEAGKTTIKEFIVDMLYGIDQLKGVGARFDHYEHKKPIYNEGYSGSMEVTIEDGRYIIERDFKNESKATKVMNLDSGMTVPLDHEHSLQGILFETNKNIYTNTLCFDQKHTATGRELADELNSYIVNMASTQSGDIDAVKTLDILEQKKKEISLKELADQVSQLNEKIDFETDFDKEIEKIKEECVKLDEIQSGTEKPEQKKEDLQEEKPSILGNIFVIFFFAILAMAAVVGLAYVIPIPSMEMKLGIMGFGLILILSTLISGLIRMGKMKKELDEQEIAENFEQEKINYADSKEYTDRLSYLKSKEEQLLKKKKEQEEYIEACNQAKEQLVRNEKQIEAIELAMSTISDLSEEIYESFGSILNEKVSEIVAKITDRKYSAVRIDENLKVKVRHDNTFFSMEYLSTGTMDQIYLALRLSIASILISENMPIVIDDIFTTYDSKRLTETISHFREYADKQIIIFTSNEQIRELFERLGMEYHYVAI